MIKLIISWLNGSFKKLIVWLQLHPKLIASDYITTGRPLGRTKGVHSCVTPQGALSGGCEAWLANPSSLTYFNTNGRVSGLGETSCPRIYCLVNSQCFRLFLLKYNELKLSEMWWTNACLNRRKLTLRIRKAMSYIWFLFQLVSVPVVQRTRTQRRLSVPKISI